MSRSRIGVAVQDVDQKLATSFGLGTPHGALVSAVDPQGPGEKRGPQARRCHHQRQRPQHRPAVRIAGGDLRRFRPGSEAHLGIWRDHKSAEVDVKTVLLEDKPAQSGAQREPGRRRQAGSGGAAARSQASSSELHTKGRLVVEDVTGPALAAGLQAGDVVLGVNGSGVIDRRGSQARGGAGRAQRRAPDPARGRADLRSRRHRVRDQA